MSTSIVVTVIAGIIALVLGLFIGYIYRKSVSEKVIGSAEQKARNLILDAEKKSETIEKEITLEAAPDLAILELRLADGSTPTDNIRELNELSIPQ